MLLLSVSLTPSEGKRLIGMSVAQMDAVQHTPSGGCYRCCHEHDDGAAP